MSALQAVPTDPAKPAASVMYVTPEMAQRWLVQNKKNRNFRDALAGAYARDMAAGRWVFTGETIKFDRHGNLLDGQHRLRAIVKSGVTLALLVVRGLDPETQTRMDSGAKRTAADGFALQGSTNARDLAALARLAIQIDRAGPLNLAVTHSEIYEWEQAHHAEAAAAVATAREYYPHIDATVTAIAYAALLTKAADAGASVTFWHTVAHKMTDGPGDPRHALIRRLETARPRRDASIRSRATRRLTRYEEVSLLVRAWNAWRTQQRLEHMKVTGGTGEPVAIPSAV